MAIDPWGIVADVLIVAALELRHPVLLFVLVEANDPPFHGEQGVWRMRAKGPRVGPSFAFAC